MDRPRTTAIRIVATVAAGLVVIGATAFSSRSPAPTSLRENKALEHGERGGTPLAAGAMRAIDGGDVAAAAAPGWAGEIQIGADDTWEPSIAADPTGPYVYAMYNGFNRPKACKSCPPIPMLLRVSSDNGVTWGPETYPCPCPGVKQFQYDPVMRVAGNGVVYATWMNKYDIVFSKSSNHGATWTAPIEVSGQPWADKPWIGVSPNGTDVYIGFATSSDVWIAASHNAGASFAPAIDLNNDMSQYRYPNGFEVLPSGVAVMSASKYPGASSQTSGAIEIETWRTTNGGASWSRTVIGNVFSGVDFSTSSTTALASDAAGALVAMYTGATAQGGTDTSGRAGRPTAGSRGRPRSRSGTEAPMRPSPRSRAVRRETSAFTTPTIGPGPGTPGTAHRPMAERHGASRPTSPTPTGARPTSLRRGSRTRTVTTARSTSRTPARQSRPGARASTSRPVPVASGSTGRSEDRTPATTATSSSG